MRVVTRSVDLARFRGLLIFLLFLASLGAAVGTDLFGLAVSDPSLAQEEGENDDEPEEEEVHKFSPAEEKAILALFGGKAKSIAPDGTVRLEYDFSGTPEESKAANWVPAPVREQNAVRWGIGHYRETYGVVLGEQGAWMHEAMWAGDARVDVTGIFISTSRPGDFVAIGIFDSKGKKGLGSNFGDQVITINGVKSGKAKPNTAPVYDVENAVKFGFEVKDRVFFARKKGSTQEHSDELPKRMKGYRIGFRWNGRVKTTIHTVVIEGKLDDAWLLKRI